MKQLNPRQATFVREYLVDLNANQAALRAGYSPSKAGLYTHGALLLRRPQIAEAVKQAMDERAERTRVTADRVLQEIAAIAFSDIGAVCAWRGHSAGKDQAAGRDYRRYDTELEIFDSSRIDPLARRAIAKVRRMERGALRIEMHDKLGALELLGRHLGLFAVKRLELTGKDGGPVRVGAAREPAPELVDAMQKLTREQRDRLRAAIKGALVGTPLEGE